MSTSERQDTTNKILALIKEIKAKSSDGDYIYRGEPECYPKVSSTLHRQFEDVDAEHFDLEKVQKEMLKQAKKYTAATDELEILTELQHHGGKTNLIDFTNDCHIALFFACDGSYDKNGRVILLKQETEQDQIRQPRNPANRVIAQKSIFVQPPKGFIRPDGEVIIPKDLKKHILYHLQRYKGIYTETIYNDLHGFIKNQGIHQSAYTEFYRALTYSTKGVESADKEKQREFYEKAIKHYTEALSLKPNLASAYCNRGAAKEELEQHEGAIEDYNEAISINPEYADAYYNRGTAKGKLGEYEEAIEDYNKAISIYPEYADAYFNRGLTKDKQGKYEEAIEDYNKAISINPEFADAYYNRGTAKGKLGKYEEAIEDFDKAISINPNLADAYNNRGTAKGKLGKYEEAIEDYNEAISINPEFAEAYYNRGVAKDKQGKYEGAIKDYDKAISINPEFADAYCNRGEAWLHLKAWEKAKSDLTTAKEKGVDIIASFHNDYKSIEDFERKNNVKLPEDIKALLIRKS